MSTSRIPRQLQARAPGVSNAATQARVPRQLEGRAVGRSAFGSEADWIVFDDEWAPFPGLPADNDTGSTDFESGWSTRVP